MNLVALLQARFGDLGFGLIAFWLTLLNGVIHIAQGLAQRRYNPGLVTAVVMFCQSGQRAFG